MKTTLRISIVLIFLAMMTACQKRPDYTGNGWEITSNNKDGTLALSQNNLGLVFDQVKLSLKKGEELIHFSKWETKTENETLLISTAEPEQTQWTIHVSETGIDFSCTDPNGVITGIAPAGGKRIPARIASQDNDVMYTQMGFVSATNICHLFDMKTDIMIQFPEESRLTRNEQDNKLMDVQVPLAEGEEISLIKGYYTNVVGLKDNQQTKFQPIYKPIPDRFKTAPTGWSSWYCYR